MNKTIGNIAKENGFNSPSEYVKHMFDERDKLVKINAGDIVLLPADYVPTHFNHESVLPVETCLVVSEVSEADIFKNYHIKITGFDLWFDHKIFRLL